MKPTLANVKKEAAKLGATVEDDSGYGFVTYQVAAPRGKVWACDGSIHWLKVCVNYEADERPTKQDRIDAFTDVLDRMTYGLANCDDSECEVCHSEPE